MSEIKNGGPAFPFFHPEESGLMAEGMTMRDYFAAKAMQAFIARGNSDFTDSEYDEGISRWAYEVADGMLRVRGQK